MTKEELQFIEDHMTSSDISKNVLKKIQNIWNKLSDKNDKYCMCSSIERKKYKENFYEWYRTIQ